MSPRASAPGKLVLLGEYGVLDDGEALVAAVNRRATGQIGQGIASEVVSSVLSSSSAPELEVQIDTTAFHDVDGRKLGLGSSAAVAVVAAALAEDSGDESTLALAIEGHRAAARGVGSGIDVAASFYGGVIACRRQPGPVVPMPSRIRGVFLASWFTGRSASTQELVRACRAAPSFKKWQEILSELSRDGISAWHKQEGQRFINIVERFGGAMSSMGREAGVDIVTDEMRTIFDSVRRHSGAAKPSGAGGGDVVIAFSPDENLGARVEQDTGIAGLDLAIDPRGLVRSR